MSTIPRSPEEPVMATTSATKKQKRTKKFTKRRMKVLVDEVSRHLDQIFGSGSSNDYDEAWNIITKEVNEAGSRICTVEECKTNWSNYRRKLTDKARKSKDLEDLENNESKRVMRIIKYLRLDEEIGRRVAENSTGNLTLEDDFDVHLVSSSTNDNESDAESSEQSLSVLDSSETLDDAVQPTTSDGSHQQLRYLEAKLEQQRSTNKILETVTAAISETLTLQMEIVRLQKDIVSAVYEMTIRRKPDEGND